MTASPSPPSTVEVRALELGYVSTDFAAMVEGQAGSIRMPVGAFLIEHRQGLVLFDSGLHPDLMTSKARLRRLAPDFEIELTEEQLLRGRLAALGIDTDDIAMVVTSHLHFDHCGGHAQVPNARIVVQRAEWQAAHDERLNAHGVYNRDDFELGHDVQLLDGPYDVFGDGSVRIEPTIGHTAGHQSLIVDDRFVLVGDACYCRLALDHDALPAHAWNREHQRATFAWLRREEQRGRHLLFAHDKAGWEQLGHP